MTQVLVRALVGAALVSGVAGAMAHDFDAAAQDAERRRIAEAFGWDLATAPVTGEAINGRLHVLFGVGGNVLVSHGEDGVLLVDDQFPEMIPRLEAAIEELHEGAVDFVINTHWHFDHADGNLALGPAGTWLVSQANSREMMLDTHVIDLVAAQYTQQAYPPAALPVITFDRAMQFHFNGERIDLFHFGPAHTTGDSAVIFRGSNVAHMGDVFNNAGYPFIDVGNGGDLDGVIAFCQAVLNEIDEETVIVPGHGPVTGFEQMQAYVAMLQVVRDRIAGLVGEGADLEAVMAAKPTEEFDERYGDPALFIDRAYFSLAGAGSGSED
jgi:glyoxylase-like metal-dependent hydrolase (beta-lactamase superfamily II)